MKRRSFLLSISALAAVGACGSQQGSLNYQFPQPQAGQGLLVMYRPANSLGAALNMPISVDGNSIGFLGNGTILTRNVAPGQYLVQSTSPSLGGLASASVSVAAGETVFIRGETAWGWPAGRPRLQQVSAAQAQPEISRM